MISIPLTRYFAQHGKVKTITNSFISKTIDDWTYRVRETDRWPHKYSKRMRKSELRARTRGRVDSGKRWKDEGGSAEGNGREDEYVSFVVATKEPPGGFANRNRRPWTVYEFPQLATGDKQIASYFCIQRLNGRRVWNEAPARYKPLLANIGGERHARRIPALSSPGRVRALPLSNAMH